MAHVNTTGRNIPLWLDAPMPQIGWGRSNAYPMQEGAFFGNIFVSPPKAHFCNGFDGDRGPVAGRIGSAQSGSPYKNPFGGAGNCTGNCTVTADGYSNCGGFTKVVTVYRDFDPAMPYFVCNVKSKMCLDIQYYGTNAGARMYLYPRTGGYNQRFYLERINSNSSSGNYRLRAKHSNLYVTTTGGSTAANAPVSQENWSGATEQRWNFIQVIQGQYLIENEKSRLLLNTNGGTIQEAPVVQNGKGSYTDAQMWKLEIAPMY